MLVDVEIHRFWDWLIGWFLEVITYSLLHGWLNINRLIMCFMDVETSSIIDFKID